MLIFTITVIESLTEIPRYLPKIPISVILQSQSPELVTIVIVSNVVIGGFSGEDFK